LCTFSAFESLAGSFLRDQTELINYETYSIKYYECVCVLLLVIPHEICIFLADNIMFRIILTSVARVSIIHFLTLPHKRHNFRKGKYALNLKKRVLIFSTTWSVKFLVLRRIKPDISLNSHKSLRRLQRKKLLS
jgi:hypothetical protein